MHWNMYGWFAYILSFPKMYTFAYVQVIVLEIY